MKQSSLPDKALLPDTHPTGTGKQINWEMCKLKHVHGAVQWGAQGDQCVAGADGSLQWQQQHGLWRMTGEARGDATACHGFAQLSPC